MRVYLTALVLLIVFTLVIDLLLWRFTKNIRTTLKEYYQRPLFIIYWGIPTAFIIFLVYLACVVDNEDINEIDYYHFMVLNGLYILFYVPKLISILTYTIGYGISTLKHQVPPNKIKTSKTQKGKTLTRAQFLGKLSLVVGAVPFAGIWYNITNGRFKFQVNKNNVPISNLPKGLEGLRIIQLSDIHLGNFNSCYHHLDGVVEHINQLNADLIFITGDLVNNFSSEAKGWDHVFSKLNAKHGKYAVLGNHDYGDYSQWKSPKIKAANFEKIKQAYESFGFELLLNTNKTIAINGETISLIGVENWGHPPFPRYGNLEKALQGDLAKTKILLTHDPDHWDAEILKHTNINLSLSGHTHGMQMGVKFKNHEWSPAKWKYKYWGGLYKVNEQYLYVNRGLGVVGIPLRIGMPPEITCLTLVQC